MINEFLIKHYVKTTTPEKPSQMMLKNWQTRIKEKGLQLTDNEMLKIGGFILEIEKEEKARTLYEVLK